MDFRAVDPDALHFREFRGAGQLRGKLAVQTPVMAFAVERAPTGQKLTLALHPTDPAHAAFRDFVARVGDRAAAALGLDPAAFFAPGQSWREMLFGGEEIFDEADSPLAALPPSGHAALVLDLRGTWASASGRWGLRWRAQQIALAPAPAFANVRVLHRRAPSEPQMCDL